MITETHANWAAGVLQNDYGNPVERHNALLLIIKWREQTSAEIARMKREAEARR